MTAKEAARELWVKYMQPPGVRRREREWMNMSIILIPKCDKCGKTFAEHASPNLGSSGFMLLRHRLKNAGWTHSTNSAKDVCPKCQPRASDPAADGR